MLSKIMSLPRPERRVGSPAIRAPSQIHRLHRLAPIKKQRETRMGRIKRIPRIPDPYPLHPCHPFNPCLGFSLICVIGGFFPEVMIPIKLTLKNFMSYGEEGATLPLEGLHVACLSGDNGNGKSALLDAMTWALWGKTRASSVKSISEDDLIRMGAK